MAPDSYDTTRDYQTILRLQIEEGLKELERPAQGQFLSSISCGLTLGIGVFSLLTVTTVLGPLFGDGAVYLLRSGAYTFGFVLAIMSQTELFTEHTTLGVLRVDGDRSSSGSWTSSSRGVIASRSTERGVSLPWFSRLWPRRTSRRGRTAG